jgi:hypothetical protein
MKRLRVFAAVKSFWKPCIYATTINPANPLLIALKTVCDVIPKLSYTLTDK